jgi:hypothetical protein
VTSATGMPCETPVAAKVHNAMVRERLDCLTIFDRARTKMRRKLSGFNLVVFFFLATTASGQVKVEDHSLGETATQFFSEAQEGVLLGACATGDFGKVNRSTKKAAKEYCALLSSTRQRVVCGENDEYKDMVSADYTKTTTYGFVAGKFVTARILFAAPDAANNNSGKSFTEIFSGLNGTYGPPTSETIVPYQNAYGVRYERHQELWLAESYAVQVDEQPGAHGWTSISVSTREVYDKQKTEKRTKPPPIP